MNVKVMKEKNGSCTTRKEVFDSMLVIFILMLANCKVAHIT